MGSHKKSIRALKFNKGFNKLLFFVPRKSHVFERNNAGLERGDSDDAGR